ncbi:histone acetylation protein-domain-containing protein [Hygrophoropsis aurantiaca]|uniref:Histone acetylation protein-domain-containing protein n=1 Tax=Hygrophoropsis aurantiaca TaxID=72124 RepID=A0ACB8AJJ3_9AGAM|nr:histone acetylation protein-domain-containing protein [Hygrophoropsis aurantiaca]
MNLRDALLAGLTDLPGTREFHLHVLVSSPRKHQNLYPFSSPRLRTYLQDILILLSEQQTPDSPPIFVSAVEACVHNVPTTSCAILYVSKVDSTGQGMWPSPTAALLHAFLLYYADPTTRPIASDHLWIHLFARAQNQYLFPNSSDFPGKRPLSDTKLCGWWKRVFSDVAATIASQARDVCHTQLYYVLPGLSEFEASQSLGASAAPTSVQWTYGHPYAQTEIPLPCPPAGDGEHRHLGQFIPSFEDDPKSRFMDELAYTTDAQGVKSPVRKRSRTDGLKPYGGDSDGDAEKDKEDGHRRKKGQIPGELKTVTSHEFWERMSFRQECVAGAVTGFFVMGVSSPSARPDNSRCDVSPLAPQPGQVSCQMNKRIMSSLLTGHEFSTVDRAVWSTKVLEESIKGLCDGLKPISHPVPTVHHHDSGRETPEPDPSRSTLAPPQTPPPRLVGGKRPVIDVSPNPFPEPVASLDTYHSHIYGSATVSNTPLTRKTVDTPLAGGGGGLPAVTVLTARKKKRTKA